MRYDTLIIGGGPAGCAAAIALAQRGLRVLLLERKRYPAPKLCGEFVSGEAAGMLARLGVLDSLCEAGPQRIEQAILVDSHGKSFESRLPKPSIGISRSRLDFLLWQRAAECGADCRDGTTVRSVQGDLKTGFRVETSAGEFDARLVISAHGKRAVLDQSLRRSAPSRSPFVAFKAHFRGDRLGNAIEMYGFPGGYCGLSPVENGLVNICWIAHEKALARAGGSVEGMLHSALPQNPALAARLDRLKPSDKFQGVSNIVLGARGAFAGDVCLVGDAAGMIAPICGDGIAMALRSSQILEGIAGDFLEGKIDRKRFRTTYTRSWNRELALRLSLGNLAHAAAISPPCAHLSLDALTLLPGLGAWLIKKTRG